MVQINLAFLVSIMCDYGLPGLHQFRCWPTSQHNATTGVTNGFPLRIEVEKVIEKQVDLNSDFLKNMFLKIEWKALVDASRSMGYAELPDNAHASMLDCDDFLQKFHHALLELHLEEGTLICPETGRRFPVNKGIPNMLLHEDEV